MNENTNAVREAQYAKEKAEYDAAMLRHRELMSRRAGAKRGELHEQFAQAAEAAEDDDASTSSKEERPPRHFLQADFEAQARQSRGCAALTTLMVGARCVPRGPHVLHSPNGALRPSRTQSKWSTDA